MELPSEVVIIGAGAAGLVAAIFAARAGARPTVLEATPDGGRKILVSGGGRCNVLPSALAPERFVTSGSPNTLRKILNSWPLAEQREFFEHDLGIPLALEAESGKLFPASNRARDVRDGLVAAARRSGADLQWGAKVASLSPLEPSADSLARWRVTLQDGSILDTQNVVLATGGLSMPGTGSDGSGLDFARTLGLETLPPYPALTPLTAEPPPHASLAGLSLNVEIFAPSERRKAQGGFLFTHRGYSGPAVLDISDVAVRSRMFGEKRAILRVRWSAWDADTWEESLLSSRGSLAKRLGERLPDRLASVLMDEAGIPRDQKLERLEREKRKKLVELLTSYELPWTGDEGYRKAEVTGGGVALSEIDPKTMQCRKLPGLFLCGEILDAWGPIGGHNFSWAWATGRAAGLGSARGRA